MDFTKHKDPDFAEEVAETMKRIKRIPGGRKKFLSMFAKTEPMIRHWIKGDVIAKLEDKANFYESANFVISEYNEAQSTKELSDRINEAKKDLGLIKPY